MTPIDWLACNGNRIARVEFPQHDDTRCPYVQSDDEVTLVCHAEYLGDRTEVWIVNFRHGIETARYNARMAETIVWA